MRPALFTLFVFKEELIMNVVFRFSAALFVFLLSACAGQLTSVDRQANHAAHQLAASKFDPAFRLNVTDTAKSLRPCLQQAWQRGVDDRQKGVTRLQAEANREALRNAENPALGQIGSIFVGKVYEADRPEKARKIMLDAMAASYRDGYEGRP
ncbi:Exc2 family lipoprotein [Pantoea sp. CCBC3-3-1]|uniref:Exc2 family lipoprotein n=1 Tax=Pantoea sp. CCBC3-3-1 TaxID=2490851 RepID=UPI0011BD74DC|nr:Exc2 family lipoprotein [Pantoea sp. CCBC3-3-1]